MALELSSLWIGDRLQIISSGRIGTYEGTSSDGRARVRHGDKVYLATTKNLRLAPEQSRQDPPIDLVEYGAKSKLGSNLAFDPTIDLHIEVLHPELINEAPQIILNHQVSRAKKHLADAISASAGVITIIHGHGTGQLRREVEHILDMSDHVSYHIPAMSGAATEAWLQ